MVRIFLLIIGLCVFVPQIGWAAEHQLQVPSTTPAQMHSSAKVVKSKSKSKPVKHTNGKIQRANASVVTMSAQKTKTKRATKQQSKPSNKTAVKKVKHNKPKHIHLKHKKAHAHSKQFSSTKFNQINNDDNDDRIMSTDTGKIAISENQSVTDEAITHKIKLKAEQLLAYATQLVGTQYRYGGVSPETGFDCSGYVSYVYKNVTGIALPHNAAAISKVGVRVARNDLRPGDLVFFRNLGRRIGHVGIYMGDDRFIHASSTTSRYVHVSSLSERYWTHNFQGARRLMSSKENYITN